MKGYLSVQETVCKWGVSLRWVNQYILNGSIPGCERFGHSRRVSENVEKPECLTPSAKSKHSPVDDMPENRGKTIFMHIG